MRIYLLLMILAIIPMTAAIECQRDMVKDDIPCTIYSSWKPVAGCTGQLDVYIPNGTLVQNINWQQSAPFCHATFNISEVGTYIYNSSINDGVIVIEAEDNMLSIILLQMFLVSFFILIGIPHKVGFTKIFSWSLAIIELLMAVWMIYINEVGGDITSLMYTNAIAILIIGGFLGFITLFRVMTKLANPDGDELYDDGYTKFMYK